MLIPAKYVRQLFGVRPKGVLHVGAHLAEEFDAYKKENFGKVLWVEAQKNLIPHLEKRVSDSGDRVFHGAVWSESGLPATINLAGGSQGASLYAFPESEEAGKTFSHEVVSTVTLQELVPADESFDFVNLDIQGAELEALRGLGSRLGPVRWVYCEVNRKQLYEGIPLIDDVDRFLFAHGFFRAATLWTVGDWGDALYMRRTGGLRDWIHRFVGSVFATLVYLGAREFTRTLRIRVKKTKVYLAKFVGLGR